MEDYRELAPLRKTLLSRLQLIALTLGILPAIAGIITAVRENLFPIAVANGLTYGAVLLFFLIRKKAFRTSAIGFVAVILAVGAVLLAETGTESASLIWLFAPLVLSVLLFNRRGVVIVFSVLFLILAGAGIFLRFDVLPWDLPVMLWTVIALSFIAIAAFIVYSIRFIINRLAASLRKERKLSRKLRRAADENGELLREIHHRVKNNLQLMLSLLRLERSEADSEDEQDALYAAENRFAALALSYSFLERTGGKLLVRFDGVLSSMTEQVHERMPLPGRLICTARLDAVTLDLERAVPLSLLVSEILEECGKAVAAGPAGEETVTLTVDMKNRLTSAELSISADPLTAASKAALEKPASGEGIGLQIIHLLAEQLNASVTLYPGEGIYVSARIPL